MDDQLNLIQLVISLRSSFGHYQHEKAKSLRCCSLSMDFFDELKTLLLLHSHHGFNRATAVRTTFNRCQMTVRQSSYALLEDPLIPIDSWRTFPLSRPIKIISTRFIVLNYASPIWASISGPRSLILREPIWTAPYARSFLQPNEDYTPNGLFLFILSRVGTQPLTGNNSRSDHLFMKQCFIDSCLFTDLLNADSDWFEWNFTHILSPVLAGVLHLSLDSSDRFIGWLTHSFSLSRWLDELAIQRNIVVCRSTTTQGIGKEKVLPTPKTFACIREVTFYCVQMHSAWFEQRDVRLRRIICIHSRF